MNRRHHWSIVSHEYLTTAEPILSRRRPFLSPMERRKRRGMIVNHDEIEIPLDDMPIQSLVSATITTTTVDNTISDGDTSYPSTLAIERDLSNHSNETMTASNDVGMKHSILQHEIIDYTRPTQAIVNNVATDLSDEQRTSTNSLYSTQDLTTESTDVTSEPIMPMNETHTNQVQSNIMITTGAYENYNHDQFAVSFVD
jgi:hypothetical protein